MTAKQILEHHRRLSASFGSDPLLVHPDGHIINLAAGYIPLLSTFTTEDKAAKGLRKGKETSALPIYFSLLELVRDNPVLLLSGPIGSGKSTFAKHLCHSLVAQEQIVENTTSSVLTGLGSEQWDTSGLKPCYFAIKNASDLETLARDELPTLLASLEKSTQPGLAVVLDAVENTDTNEKPVEHIETIISQILASTNQRHRLLLLSGTSASNNLALPPSVTRYNIRPLSVAQRRQKISQLMHSEHEVVDFALGGAAANPAVFALQVRHTGDRSETVIDAWLAALSENGNSTGCLEENAFFQTCRNIGQISALETMPQRNSNDESSLLAGSGKILASSRRIAHLLTARHLSNLPADAAVSFFRHNPVATANIIQSVLVRLQQTAHTQKFDNLVQALLRKGDQKSQHAALLLAKTDHISAQLQGKISRQALSILSESQLPFCQRQDAAGVLSRFGDPRDMTALASVSAGTLTLGSNSHPNSQPIHQLHIDTFRIGLFPVTVRQYAEFVIATDHHWVSPERHDLHKQNFPVTDVTWHDAVAYCQWLTSCWRAEGKISEDERVRLPTEPEWERAARGGGYDQQDVATPQCLYPWGFKWHGEACNSEETGLNQPCAVGLFPRSASPYGCQDMAGNVWEWCSTLWGEDMTTPSFCYPWKDDGREAAEAPPTLRRVLRGGCFSSGRLKANCTYRGSLEPNGYWRGNGFRIVVSQGK